MWRSWSMKQENTTMIGFWIPEPRYFLGPMIHQLLENLLFRVYTSQLLLSSVQDWWYFSLTDCPPDPTGTHSPLENLCLLLAFPWAFLGPDMIEALNQLFKFPLFTHIRSSHILWPVRTVSRIIFRGGSNIEEKNGFEFLSSAVRLQVPLAVEYF